QVKGLAGVGYLTGITKIAAGRYHSLALKSDGTVYAWGGGDYGQLGDGSNNSRLTPIQVKGVGGVGYLTDVIEIAGGTSHSLALKSDGTVFAWGNNTFCQQGNGTTTNWPTPVQVKGVGGVGYLTDIESIMGGLYHSLALKSDGTVYAWGGNSFGELGDGTTTSRCTPVQVKDVVE
ncbi:MAG: hypothetical protein PHS29_02030, partial [Candidatus Pacebacteria bacterium]|nr:hypothetical protein [Candidatus Paceibacterota bacterium]